jgi:hypothetical protein
MSIKNKQKCLILPLFKNLQGEKYKWIPVMIKRGLFRIEIDTENFYQIHFYGVLRDIFTKIYVQQNMSNRHLICRGRYLHSKLNTMKFKKACCHIKDRMKYVEYYYDSVWMSLPCIPDIKRLIIGYL